MNTSAQNLVYADLGPTSLKRKHHVPVHNVNDDRVQYAHINYQAETHGMQATKNDRCPAGMIGLLNFNTCRLCIWVAPLISGPKLLVCIINYNLWRYPYKTAESSILIFAMTIWDPCNCQLIRLVCIMVNHVIN